jgi:hypothetical protein
MSVAQTWQTPVRKSTTEDHRSDPTLAAVLQRKPCSDEVPLAAWWFLAEALGHSVVVRRAAEGVAIIDAPMLRLAIERARFAAEAALEELDDCLAEPSTDDGRSAPGIYATVPTVRATTSELARLIVSARATPTDRLRTAILLHLDALRLAV